MLMRDQIVDLKDHVFALQNDMRLIRLAMTDLVIKRKEDKKAITAKDILDIVAEFEE
jgi:hypothetical protein